MSIKITIPNSSSDVLTFGSGNTPTAAQIAGIDSGSSNGQLALYTTASGTSTERVRINASGNVGVGTVSPATTLHLRSAVCNVRLEDADTSAYANVGVDNSGSMYLQADPANSQASSTMYFSVDGTERMRIDSSGSLTLPGKLYAGQYQGDGTNDFVVMSNNASKPIVFYTGVGGVSAVERARIDSSGVVSIGTSAAPTASPHQIVNNANGSTIANFLNYGNSTPYGIYVIFQSAAPNNNTQYFYYAIDNAATRFVVKSNGGINNYTANNVNLSDQREKTNFAPAGNYLAKICAIPVQTFNYIDQNMEEDDGLTLGVVAQDVAAVAPELVIESNWGTEEEPKMRLGIYQTDLQYALMTALQELKAEFDVYKASHP